MGNKKENKGNTIHVSPLTRIEGHLDIQVTVAAVNGELRVVDARSAGTMFRGFERILEGREPRDASHYTQRICGVCPVSHGMAASKTLENAFGVTPADNGRILRNLILAANFVQSHVLHFYHLAALDYIDTTGLLDLSPWIPRFTAPDMIKAGDGAEALVEHYVQALAIRRQAHQMGALFGGKLPMAPSLVPGGCSDKVTANKIAAFRSLLDQIRAFVSNVYVRDAEAIASRFPLYGTLGRGCGNLLSYGVFDLDAAGATRFLQRGRLTGGALLDVDTDAISEDILYSYYKAAKVKKKKKVKVLIPGAVGGGGSVASGGLANPGATLEPDAKKKTAYSWLKAPRYDGEAHEAGPLARMWVSNKYRNGISVADRLLARALETELVADAMDLWLDQLVPGQPTYTPYDLPSTAAGIGLTEAPRGALAHWIQVANRRIARYNVITPTAWNGSPMDDRGQKGPIEQALLGAPVANRAQPIELLRIVHSFDPCLACAVHLARPGEPPTTLLLRG
jgi:hydrogenase large subunit